MKIAILSDAHDQVENFKSAVEQIKKINPDVVLFCGDFSAPFMPPILAKEFSKPIHVVFGNNDGDKYTMLKVSKDLTHMVFHGEYAALELGGKRVGMTHYPFYAEVMAKSGDYDVVCFGHDHEPRILTFDQCLAVNPGSIYGNKAAPSFALYDTDNHQAILYNLDGAALSQ